jgi:hypothetical protein
MSSATYINGTVESKWKFSLLKTFRKVARVFISCRKVLPRFVLVDLFYSLKIFGIATKQVKNSILEEGERPVTLLEL